MGTSKGYISPSTPNWASAKRGVTTYVGNPTPSSRGDAVSKFARAMNADETMSRRASVIFSNFASFVQESKNHGLSQALNNHQINYIIDLPPEEALIEMINAFNEGNTIDDSIANNCISEALDVLEVTTLDDLANLEINVLIKELVCQFAQQKFAQMFDKHIKNKCDNIITANERIGDIQNYIYYKLRDDLTPEKLALINPLDLANEKIIDEAMKEAFSILEYYYG